jgi:hypothetical protein
MDAMLTRVATASSAVGGTPTVCKPHGSSRDSISMIFPYTFPTTKSRSSMLRVAVSNSSSGS